MMKKKDTQPNTLTDENVSIVLIFIEMIWLDLISFLDFNLARFLSFVYLREDRSSKVYTKVEPTMTS